ncbi:hypothetical protein [Sphingomonas sp. LaA6.9]|uniref:hypothetical protein n=1 Tax=Sphingomonas sp. LaA6.9 TaxID=2919914 RepID=UPI001F5011F5|nr:hypothetical protein [Sphingomonas sp. LaA6.9]MCJ8157644.1 hypothetical protein [Sphingomonas sp. LaA6.9]
MITYRLDIRMNPTDPDESVAFEASDDAEAANAARAAIAEAFGRPDELVLLDPDRGQFTIGAGLWSRRGTYRLRATEDVAGLPRF